MTLRSPSLRLRIALLGATLFAGLLVMLLLRRDGGLQPLRGVAPLDLDEVPSLHAVDALAPMSDVRPGSGTPAADARPDNRAE